MGIPIVAALAAVLVSAPELAAQQTQPNLSVAQAVESALQRYPAIAVSQEQINASAAAIDLARTTYLPRIDSVLQLNRATRNNVFGLLLPQGVIPSISGPVLGTNNWDSVWGSAAGVLVSWEPFDFGLRRANVKAAAAAKTRSEATLERTRLDVAAATADAYVTLLAAQETTRAAQAGVDRAQVLVRSVRAQVDAQLRPGADASRAEAELALAQTQLARAQQARDIARAVLAQFIGGEPNQISIATPKLLQAAPRDISTAFTPSAHPSVVEQSAVVDQKNAGLAALEKSWVPRLFTQGSFYARGTGALPDGTREGGLNGLAPDTRNYGVGVTVTFPFLDLPSLHAREAAQSASIRAEVARNQQLVTDLTSRWNAAAAALEGSRTTAEYTPVQVSAARAASQQTTARYEAGLGTIVEVADAQRLLTQAQIDDALAQLGVWRALLGVAAASGDIRPFLQATQ
jgi:outer membrane protein TolC